MKQNTEWDIKQQVRKIGCQYTGATEMEIKHIGGGFYGRVYRLTFGNDSRRLVAKIYGVRGLAAVEAEQLRILKRYSRLQRKSSII